MRELVHSTPQMVRRVIDQVNSERLVLAHLGGHLYWDGVLDCIAGQNCCIDTALAVGAINPYKMLEIFEKHGYDRILYGSDTPWGSQKISVGTFLQLLLPQENIDKIMYRNAVRLIGLSCPNASAVAS